MSFLMLGAFMALIAGICASGPVLLRLFIAAFWGMFGMLSSWLALPVLAWGWGGILFLVFITGMGSAVIGCALTGKFKVGTLLSVAALIAVCIVVPFFSTTAMTDLFGTKRASAYHKLIGNVPSSRFEADVAPVDVTNIRTVDQTLASQMASKRLGQERELGGRVSVGTMNIQSVDGTIHFLETSNGAWRVRSLNLKNDMLWAGPLNHDGFMRWLNDGPTPGYVLTSMTDHTRNYLIAGICVQEGTAPAGQHDRVRVEGFICEPFEMRYLKEGSYFNGDLKRHIYANGYNTVGMAEPAFEIDDTGRPYWVVPLLEKKIGFSGTMVKGVLTVDPQTGVIQEYTIENAPAWIDRVQPEDIVKDLLDWYGSYGNGYWNATFGAKQNVIITTPGVSLVRGADGHTYWYTDMKLGKTDSDASTGFVLVNTRNAEARYYTLSNGGASADRVMAAVRGLYPEKGYQLTEAILYNVAGKETYFTVMKGPDGLPKMYAFVDLETASLIGVGETPDEALRQYRLRLIRSNSAGPIIDLANSITKELRVMHIVAIATDNTTVFYIRFDDLPLQEFFGGSQQFPELKWTREGDTVRITYLKSEDPNRKETSVPLQGYDRLNDPLVGE